MPSVLAYTYNCTNGSTVSVTSRGQLVCDSTNRYSLPKGSYQSSCSQISIGANLNGQHIVYAICPNSFQLQQTTSLNYGQYCKAGSTISNVNGLLRCDKYISLVYAQCPTNSIMQNLLDNLYCTPGPSPNPNTRSTQVASRVIW